MLDDQKQLIEVMIAKHKSSNSGKVQWKNFRNEVFSGDHNKEEICYHLMLDRGLIKTINLERKITMLTENGLRFRGFVIEEKENKNTLKEERVKTWPQRNWPIVAIFSFVFGSIISPLATKYIERKIWPDPNQLHTPIQRVPDTSGKKW